MKQDLAYQNELLNRMRTAEELAISLEKINTKIAKLRIEKELIECELIATIGHEYEGSKTYEVGHHAVTIKTDMIYSLDKKAYTKGDLYIPSGWNPIIEKTTYEVNKKLFNEYESTSPESVRSILSELVTRKPSKPNVTLKVRA